MPSVTLKKVMVSGESISFEVQTDLSIGGVVLTYGVYISRSEATQYMADNAGATIDDLILEKVKAGYAPLTKMKAKAETLVNKVLSW